MNTILFVYVHIYTILYCRIKAIATETARDVIFRVLICLVSLGVAGVVCCGRLYLQYHTFSQIVGGAVVGSISGILWFLLVQVSHSHQGGGGEVKGEGLCRGEGEGLCRWEGRGRASVDGR